MSPYYPVFLDGWKPEACDENGQAFEDPIESQKKYETLLERQQVTNTTGTQTLAFLVNSTNYYNFFLLYCFLVPVQPGITIYRRHRGEVSA